MNNVDPMRIRRTGTITITKGGIRVDGFEVDGASCREAAILATTWAIGQLQRELHKAIREPGKANIQLD